MQFRSMASSFQYRLRQDLKPASIADWREAARRALPEMIWAYVDDGAEGCRTKTRNEAAFDEHRLRQLCLTGVTAPKLAKRFAGTDLSMPFALAPTGMTALSHWSGDIACAQAAEAAGIRYTLSGACSYSPGGGRRGDPGKALVPALLLRRPRQRWASSSSAPSPPAIRRCS